MTSDPERRAQKMEECASCPATWRNDWPNDGSNDWYDFGRTRTKENLSPLHPGVKPLPTGHATVYEFPPNWDGIIEVGYEPNVDNHPSWSNRHRCQLCPIVCSHSGSVVTGFLEYTKQVFLGGLRQERKITPSTCRLRLGLRAPEPKEKMSREDREDARRVEEDRAFLEEKQRRLKDAALYAEDWEAHKVTVEHKKYRPYVESEREKAKRVARSRAANLLQVASGSVQQMVLDDEEVGVAAMAPT